MEADWWDEKEDCRAQTRKACAGATNKTVVASNIPVSGGDGWSSGVREGLAMPSRKAGMVYWRVQILARCQSRMMIGDFRMQSDNLFPTLSVMVKQGSVQRPPVYGCVVQLMMKMM